MKNPLKLIKQPRLALPYTTTFVLMFFALIPLGSRNLFSSNDVAILPIEEYWERMEDTLTVVGDLMDQDHEYVESTLETLAKQWDRIDTVQLLDGTRITVDHSILVQQLRLKPPNLSHLQKFLVQIIQTANTWPSKNNLPSDILLLQSILDQPEFDWKAKEPSPFQQWLSELQMKIMEFILNLLPNELGVNFSGSLLNFVLIAVSLIILALVLFYMGRNFLTNFIREAELDDQENSHQESLTAENARLRADVQSHEGNYRAAVRFLYLSVLLSIVERGIIHFDASKTNREVLLSVHDQPDLVKPLREVFDVFDRVWYGYQPIEPEHYAQYAARIDELRRLSI